MAQQNFEEWYREALEASESGRSYLASPFLHAWDEMVVFVPASVSDRDLTKLKEKLLFTAFCDLPIVQAAGVIEKGLLNFLASDVDISDALKNRFLFVGYGNENKDRAVLREAALHNEQPLGGKKVFEWLQDFDKAFPPEGLHEAAAGKFFTQNPEIVALSKTEQAFLRRLLQIYDEWLRAPLATIFDTAVIYKKLVELERAGVKTVNMNTFEKEYLSPRGTPRASLAESRRASTAPSVNIDSQASIQRTVSLPLLQALSKYENLGNQLITRERIKVKSQPEPVRPSLLYWVKYYRDELGIGQHNSVERGDFLFRSENGRKLSPEEREHVNLILKSIEENFPLTIDTEYEEIVFPVFQGVLVESHNELRPAHNDFRTDTLPARSSYVSNASGGGRAIPAVAALSPDVSMPQRQTFFHQPPARNDSPVRTSYANNVSDGGKMHIDPNTTFSTPPTREAVAPAENGSMSFSASHIFPAEKEAVEKRAAMREDLLPQRAMPRTTVPAPPSTPSMQKPRSTVPPFNPFNIHPVSLGRDEEE